MSSNNPYEPQPQPGPYGQGGEGGQPPGPYGYPPPNTPPGEPGYAFGPFAPQQAAGPMPGPPPPPGPPPRRGRVPLILGVVALALILVGVTTALVVWRTGSTVQSQPVPTSVPGGTTAAAPTSAPPTALPSDAVSGYLNALAAGDATKALSYAADPAQPGPFMTKKVLAESIKRAPLTAIDVPEVTNQQATTVPASYRLGKTEVNTSYDVVNSAGTWKLATVHKTIDLGLVRSPSMPMLINGVKVNADFVDLLPGSYAFTAGSPNLTYGSKSVVTITDPKGYANVLDLRPSLSDRGRKTAVSLANKSYDTCLRSKVPRPRNCPFSWANPAYRFRSGSVTWRQVGSDPFRKPTVELSGTSATVKIPLRVRISGPCVYQGRSGFTCSGRVTGDAWASIRLDREKLSVVWLA